MVAKPLSQRQGFESPVGLFLWVCDGCDFAVFGDQEDAHQHHHEPGGFGHWIYEVRQNENGMFHVPTGRNIHTSSTGGFYHDDEHLFNGSVEETFFKMEMNRRARRLSA